MFYFAAPSSPPRGFYGTARSNTSIMLQWQPPVESAWNGPLLGYIIFYKLAGYDDDGALYRNITNYVITSHELVGLIWFTEYEIRIAAYNAEGVGAYTPGINVWTHEGHPTTAPLNVETVALNSTSVKVSWDSCDPQQINGVNLGYKIFALNSVGETEMSVPPKTDWKDKQIGFLMDLEKYTDYEVTVACYTTPGNGPRSTPPSTVWTMEDGK